MFYEFKHIGSSDYFVKEYGEDFSFPPHMHLCFELVVVLDGEMKVTVDGNDNFLHKGEALLIFPNQLHSLESEKSRHLLCIFSPDLVRAYASKTEKSLPESNFFVPDTYLVETLDKTSEDAKTISKKGVLYSLCAAFDNNAAYVPKKTGQKGLLSKIFAFVEQNFAGECTLEELSSQIGYDYAYLSRSFKKTAGISYVAYLNIYRLNKACYLLDNTDKSILQCALDSGYSSLRTFNRNFKKQFDISPAEYRKKGIK
ncbi:MAG: helix-turn-helix transcriptional regulator [Clostridia bacterium]|nr:helix-turn-helix transcriptional regulator [Clostridia bacterium]